jgi:hypothetical protein
MRIRLGSTDLDGAVDLPDALELLEGPDVHQRGRTDLSGMKCHHEIRSPGDGTAVAGRGQLLHRLDQRTRPQELWVRHARIASMILV